MEDRPMLPKDLLVHLEKGDRTMEVLKDSPPPAPAVPQQPSQWPWREVVLGQIAGGANQFANQQLVAQQATTGLGLLRWNTSIGSSGVLIRGITNH